VKLPELIAVIPLLLAAPSSLAETGYVTVLVEDAHQHPVRLVEIGIEEGVSKLTKDDGEAQLPLAQTIKADDWISFQLLHSPPGKDLAIVSPWDNRIPVPSFADKTENLIKIVVVQRGDRAALESGSVLASLTAKINKENALKTAKPQAQSDPKEALLAIAKQYDLSPDDIDSAIRAWGLKTTDPYEAGMAALYEHNYPKATTALEDSLHQREQKLQADQRAATQDQKNVADAAFFLGQSLYGQGHYRESALAFQKCLVYRPDDATVLNNVALSLADSGDLASAEPVYRRALAIDEKTLGPDHPHVARDLNNLAELLRARGDYTAAEPLYRRALAINEKAFGPDHPDVAADLNNLAGLLQVRGDLAATEPLYRRALAINEKALGPDHPLVAADLNNLAALLRDKGDLATAEPLYRRALAINEKALGPDHPLVGTDLNNLALLLRDKGDLAAAEPLFRRALAIDEKALGPDHPDVARDLNNLALVLRTKGDLATAEPLYRRAIAIDEKALGLDHPLVATYLDNLAFLLAQRDLAAAEPLFRRALAINEKALGPDHPDVATDLNNLAGLLETRGDLAAAEPLFRRALAIDEKALGPDHPTTKSIRANMDDLENHLAKVHQ